MGLKPVNPDQDSFGQSYTPFTHIQTYVLGGVGGFSFTSDKAEQAASITRAIRSSLDPAEEAEETRLLVPYLT